MVIQQTKEQYINKPSPLQRLISNCLCEIKLAGAILVITPIIVFGAYLTLTVISKYYGWTP